MAEWDIIECGYNAADETINFGTRELGDSANLYESSTLATIRSSIDNLVTNPITNSSTNNGKVFFTVNESLKVFDNLECSSLCFEMNFDNIIETYCVTSNNLLFTCMRNGTMYAIQIAEETNCLFNKLLVDHKPEEGACFVNCYLESDIDVVKLLIVTTNGKLFRVTFSNKLNEVSCELVIDLQCVVTISAFNYPKLLVSGFDYLTVYDVDCDDIISEECSDILKAYPHSDMFIALTKNQELIRLCADTLTMFYINSDEAYKDFVIIPDNSDKCNLLTVTEEKNELGDCCIQLRTLEGFETIFSFKLTNPVLLVTLESTGDEILYITQIVQNDVITEFRFTVVYETVPINRLERLLRKQDFEKAEKFAELFGLDVNLIRKAKAQVIVDKMICNEEDTEMLLTMLDSIGDVLFSLHCCCDVHLSCKTTEDVRKVLVYGCRELPNNLVSNSEALTLYTALCNLKYRFEMFTMLLYNRESTFDMRDWFYFSGCDLIEELVLRLKNYNVEEAVIIYSRLDNSTFNLFVVENVKSILEVLNNMPPDEYMPFLHVFIPVTLAHLPTALPLFVNWLCNRIIFIEQKYGLRFPENAIGFAENVVRLLQVKGNSLDTNLMNKLTNLSTALGYLQVLKNNFKIVVPMKEYLKGPKCFIRTLLNISMDEDEYDVFLQRFLNNYILENHFSPDEIFLNEIQDITKYDEKYWIRLVPQMLKCINSVEVKLQAILILIKAARLPWSNTFRGICEKALEYSHPLVEEIKRNIENHPIFVVLRKPKYNFKAELPSLRDLKFFINRIIKVNEPTMLEDIYQICKGDVERHEANLILARHFIKLGEYSKVCAVIDNNMPDEVFECCKNLIIFVRLSIDDKYGLANLQKNCHEVARAIHNRLRKSASDLKLQHDYFLYDDNDLKQLDSIYKIDRMFRKKITVEDLQNGAKKKALLECLISDVVDEFQDGKIGIDDCIESCTIVSSLLSEDRDAVLLNFCSKVEHFNAILQSAELIYETSVDSRDLCLIAVLILKYIGSVTSNFNQTALDLNETFVPQNAGTTSTNVFVEGLRLAGKAAAKAVLSSDGRDLDACIEVLKWVQTTCFMTLVKNDVLQAEIKCSFVYDLAVPTNNAFGAVKKLFNLYVDYMKGVVDPNTRYLTYFNSNGPALTQEELTQEINYLPQSVQNMCAQGQTLSAYKLTVVLKNSLANVSNLSEDASKSLSAMLKFCMTQLLQQVISARYIDSELAYNLLLAYDCEKAQTYLSKAITMYKRDVHKVHVLALVALRILESHKKSTKNKVYLQDIIVTCKWWKKIKADNVSCTWEMFFKVTPEQRLKKLVSLDYLDEKSLQEFCDDFSLDIQKCYLSFLKITLSNWKPEFVVNVGAGGKRSVIVKSSEAEIFAKCKPIVDRVKNKELLHEVVDSLWSQVNFYYYELFICLLKLSPRVNNPDAYKKQLLLLFLKRYTRVSDPSQAEIEQWYTMFPDTQKLDELSEWRLPFTQTLLTNDIWSIIRPEVTLRTYEYWFDATDILKGILSKDDICSFVIKEVVSSGLLKKRDLDAEWTMHSMHEALFKEIDVCVQNINDLERATAVVHHLMMHTPRGADQVNAATLCYKYALKYQKQCPDAPDVQKAFVKVHKKYLSYSAMHILYINRLAEEKYLKLVSQPNELIESLYMDDRIVKSANSVVLHLPDINKTVDELGVLYEIDVTQKRMFLLDSWFSSSSGVNLNATLSTLLSNADSSTDTCDDNLKRASYLCTSDAEFWKTFLVDMGFGDTKSYSYKANALTCFCKITNVETVEEMTNLTKEELKNCIEKLFLISDLQYAGYTFTIETLDASNKRDILRNLAQNSSYASNIKIMAAICMAYSIYNLKYWEVIMNAANQMNLLKELQEYLQFLKSVTECTTKAFYIKSWQKVVEHLFSTCTNQDRKNATEVCVENIRTVQTCPVLFSLDFSNVISNLLKSNLQEFAAVLLQYLPKDKRVVYVKKILKIDPNISKTVDKLGKRGVWCINNIKRYFELDLAE